MCKEQNKCLCCIPFAPFFHDVMNLEFGDIYILDGFCCCGGV